MRIVRLINEPRVQRRECVLKVRLTLVVLLLLIQVSIATAGSRSNDIMGAHLNSGRGCAACHSYHGQSFADSSPQAQSPSLVMLWGNNAAATYAINGGGLFQTLGDRTQGRGVLSCLSCHDGNYAPRAMMRNVVYERVPGMSSGGPYVPTLLDADDFNTGNNIDDHPIGSAAQLRCGGGMGWDCQQSHGAIRMQGAMSSRFAENYGFFVEPAHSGESSFVFCTTCHNPHSMTWTAVSAEKASIFYPAGEYPTRHFLRAPSYDEGGTSSTESNRRAQFCRQCHADKSNEMNGSLAGTRP